MALFKKKSKKVEAAPEAEPKPKRLVGDILREKEEADKAAAKPPPRANPRRLGAVDRMAGRTEPRR